MVALTTALDGQDAQQQQQQRHSKMVSAQKLAALLVLRVAAAQGQSPRLEARDDPPPSVTDAVPSTTTPALPPPEDPVLSIPPAFVSPPPSPPDVVVASTPPPADVTPTAPPAVEAVESTASPPPAETPQNVPPADSTTAAPPAEPPSTTPPADDPALATTVWDDTVQAPIYGPDPLNLGTDVPGVGAAARQPLAMCGQLLATTTAAIMQCVQTPHATCITNQRLSVVGCAATAAAAADIPTACLPKTSAPAWTSYNSAATAASAAVHDPGRQTTFCGEDDFPECVTYSFVADPLITKSRPDDCAGYRAYGCGEKATSYTVFLQKIDRPGDGH